MATGYKELPSGRDVARALIAVMRTIPDRERAAVVVFENLHAGSMVAMRVAQRAATPPYRRACSSSKHGRTPRPDRGHAARGRSSLPFYEFTAQLAALEPLPDDLEQLLLAIRGNQQAMDEFARVGGAVTSPADFLSEANVRRLLVLGPSREPV